MPSSTRFFIDSSRPDNSGDGMSEATAWKNTEAANTLGATPFYFGAGCSFLFKAGQTHTLKKLLLVKQGGAAGWIFVDRYGEGPDPILLTAGTNDEAFLGAAISVDSCYRVRVQNLDIDVAWQTTGLPGGGVSCIGQKHLAEPSLVHALEVVNCIGRRAGQDAFGFHAFSTSESPTPSFLVNSFADRAMDNGWGLYAMSNGFTAWNNRLYGCGNASLSVPDYGPFGGDGGSAHESARNVLDAFNRYEENRDGSHHIQSGLPGQTMLCNYYRGNLQSALKLMDYDPALTVTPQFWNVIGCVFALPAGMTGNGGVIFGRDGDDGSGGALDVKHGGVFAGRFLHNTIYNASAQPGLFLSWLNDAANDGAAFDMRNNVFVRAGTGAHIDARRRTRTIAWVAGRNAFNTDASGQFLLDGSNADLAGMKAASIIGAASVAADPLLVGDPDTDPANATLGPSSPSRGVAENLEAVAAAIGVSVRELYASVWSAARPRDLGAAPFRSAPSGLLLPVGPVPAFPGYAFFDA